MRLRQRGSPILGYRWQSGMRSRSLAWLLNDPIDTMDPIAKEWIGRILRAVEEHDDLISGGPQLAGDRRLSQEGYEDTVRELSKSLWGNSLGNLLSTAMDLRDVARARFLARLHP